MTCIHHLLILRGLVLNAGLLACSAAMMQSQLVDFNRTFKAGEEAKYKVSMELPGLKTEAEIETSIVKLAPNGATVRYRALKLDMGIPSSEPLPELTTMCGPSGMPNGASIRDSRQFFVYLSAAGITPNVSAHVGDTVSVHWQNDSKGATFDGHGKLIKLDSAANTLSVDWDLTMTPSYTTGAHWKLTSVYSTTDFSLKSARGTMDVGGSTASVKVDRES